MKGKVGLIGSFFSLFKTPQAKAAKEFLQGKKRHTICRRAHHFVPAGKVDHLIRPDISECKDIKSNFCFCPCLAGGSNSLVQTADTTAMVERSCYECAGCFNLDKVNCKLAKYTGTAVSRLFKLKTSNGTGLATRRAQRQVALQSRLKSKVKAGVNVVVCNAEVEAQGTHAYSWAIDKSLGKPRRAAEVEKDHVGLLLRGTWDNSGRTKKYTGPWVLDVNQYDILKMDCTEYETYDAGQSAFKSDPMSVGYCIRTPTGRCPKKWAFRGAAAGCFKQHKQTYRLTQIREPAGFKLTTLLPCDVRKTRKKNKNAPLSYRLSTGVLQKNNQNMGALDIA